MADFQPPKKKAGRSASVAGSRFKAPTDNEEMATISKGFVPPNTKKNTAWAVNVFEEWRVARKEATCDSEHCPEDLLSNPTAEALNRWIPKFIVEARKVDGSPYPPRSINQILAALQRHMRELRPDAPKFLDKNDWRFHSIRGTCETVYRQLHQQGVGANVKHTAIFTPEEEEKLWVSGALSIKAPLNLQRAVFFYVGKIFCVRGGQEQRSLTPSQFVRSEEPDCYTYVEHGSKNRSGGPSQLRVENKTVPVYSVPDKVPQCLVFLLDFYLAKLPKYAFEKEVFYCRPKTYVPKSPEEPWYDCCPVGKNTLANMVKDMCMEAGITEPKTNHSLRATGTTRLFQANVPEKIIQKTTGHRSLEALRTYERVSTEQHQAVSRVLTSSDKVPSFDTEVENVRKLPISSSMPSVSRETDSRNSACMPSCFTSLFSGFNNCSIGQICVNIKPTINQTVEQEFDTVVKDLEV